MSYLDRINEIKQKGVLTLRKRWENQKLGELLRNHLSEEGDNGKPIFENCFDDMVQIARTHPDDKFRFEANERLLLLAAGKDDSKAKGPSGIAPVTINIVGVESKQTEYSVEPRESKEGERILEGEIVS